MQRPLQITFHGMEHSDAIEQSIRDHVAELERFSDRITGCHVTVDAGQKRHHQGNLFSVRVDLRLPDREIIAGKERQDQHAHEDCHIALRDAFNAAGRQLEEYSRRRREEARAPRHEEG